MRLPGNRSLAVVSPFQLLSLLNPPVETKGRRCADTSLGRKPLGPRGAGLGRASKPRLCRAGFIRGVALGPARGICPRRLELAAAHTPTPPPSPKDGACAHSWGGGQPWCLNTPSSLWGHDPAAVHFLVDTTRHWGGGLGTCGCGPLDSGTAF